MARPGHWQAPLVALFVWRELLPRLRELDRDTGIMRIACESCCNRNANLHCACTSQEKGAGKHGKRQPWHAVRLTDVEKEAAELPRQALKEALHTRDSGQRDAIFLGAVDVHGHRSAAEARRRLSAEPQCEGTNAQAQKMRRAALATHCGLGNTRAHLRGASHAAASAFGAHMRNKTSGVQRGS